MYRFYEVYIGCILFLCLTIALARTDTDTSVECTIEENKQLASSLFDSGVLAAGGCDLSNLGHSRQCCDTLTKLMAHKCSLATLELFDSIKGYPPHKSMVSLISQRCGAELGVGFLPRDDCGDGAVVGWERCDDGNRKSADGCSECWVDEGFSCGLQPNGTSVCRECLGDCSAVNRDVCSETAGACGECLEGFQETEDGICGRVYEVLYTAIDEPTGETLQTDCHYHSLGTVVETERFPTADRYLEVVRASTFLNRTGPPPPGNCKMRGAFAAAPKNAHTVVMIEILFDRFHDHDMDVGSVQGSVITPTLFIVFSDEERGHPVPVLTSGGNGHQYFDVFAWCTLLVYRMVIENAAYTEGGVVRAWASTVILEDITVQYSKTHDLRDYVQFEYACEGDILSVNGALMVRDTIFRNNTITAVVKDQSCLVFHEYAILCKGTTELHNVTFLDNDVVGALMKFESDSVIWNDVVLMNNVAHTNSLVASDSSMALRSVEMRRNAGARGAVLSMQGMHTLHVADFAIEQNTALDGGGIIYNSGEARFQGGVISENEASNSIIVNRASLSLVNVTVSDNRGAVLDSTSAAEISSCTFRNNSGASLYKVIYNIGALTVEDSFVDANNQQGIPVVESADPFVLLNSPLPDDHLSVFAQCDSVLSQNYFPRTHVCGALSACESSSLGGLDCYCPESHPYGDPRDLCGRLSSLHILPDDEVAIFAKKEIASEIPQYTLRFLADGLGAIDWAIDSAPLPPWLLVSPLKGRFVSAGVCPDDYVDVTLSVDLEHITGNDPSRITAVSVYTNASFSNERSEEIHANDALTIDVSLDVEVVPSAATSSAEITSECQTFAGSQCIVEAGSPVTILVSLRDWANYSLGVGGASFDVDFTEVVTVGRSDLDNGHVLLNFDVPQAPLSLSVTIGGSHVMNSPLGFGVRCTEDYEWDEESQHCVQTTFSLDIPGHYIGLGVVALFGTIALAFRALRNKGHYLRAAFNQSETQSIYFHICMDILDLGKDVGTTVSVALDASLQTYAPWYLSVVSLSAVPSLMSILYRRRALRAILEECKNASLTASLRRPHMLKSKMFISGVPGVSEVETEEDVDLVLRMLQRRFTSQAWGIVLLIFEDIPMQILNTFVLASKSSGQNVAVVVATQITCVVIGVKACKIVGAWRTSRQMERIKRKTR
eukprot:Rmarinus@m.9812